MTRSKRWKRQTAEMHGKGNLMRKFKSFYVEPGMSTWFDMPDEYKKQFFVFQKSREEQQARELKQKKTTFEIDARVKERISAMEKRVSGIGSVKRNAQATTVAKASRVPKKKFNNQTAAQVCNFIDRQFFTKRKQQIIDKLEIKPNRKSVLLIADVCGWAWWNKSQYLEAYLADEYDCNTICLIGPEQAGINTKRYDLYLTYGYSYILRLQNVPIQKRLTGMTAHRPLNVLKGYMGYAANVHANSMMLMEDMKKIFPNHKRIHYVPNGVDEEIFFETNPIRTEGDLIVGHVGKKCPLKHQEDILLPAIKEAGLKSVTNLNDYTNKYPYCEMSEIYNEMDVMVVASTEDGTPNPALEAAACGRPIISNRIGNMPEFIKDGYNGFIVDLKKEQYVEKLEYLKNNRKLLVEMGKNARKTVEKEWTWKHQAEYYRTMFKKCIG